MSSNSRRRSSARSTAVFSKSICHLVRANSSFTTLFCIAFDSGDSRFGSGSPSVILFGAGAARPVSKRQRLVAETNRGTYERGPARRESPFGLGRTSHPSTPSSPRPFCPLSFVVSSRTGSPRPSSTPVDPGHTSRRFDPLRRRSCTGTPA
jgi:hypothetical protein